MKKKKLILFTSILLTLSIGFQSCIGSFTLTNKVLTWNKNVNNKFVNELVFFAFWVLPVYEVTALADLLVINSIEFWSGNIPLESNNKVITSDHGNYFITADATGYKIITPEGESLNFDFDIETQTWSFQKGENEKLEFLKFKDSRHVELLNYDGNFVDVELTRDGVDSFKSRTNEILFATL